MRISDWSSDVCSSYLAVHQRIAVLEIIGCGRGRIAEVRPRLIARIEIEKGLETAADRLIDIDRTRNDPFRRERRVRGMTLCERGRIIGQITAIFEIGRAHV